MAVNSYLVYEKIDKCIEKKLMECTTRCNIKYVTIYNPLIGIKSNTIYLVVDKKCFPTEFNGENALMIVLGKLDPDILSSTQYECICVEESYGLGKLYEKVNEILEYYNDWEEAIAELLIRGGTLDELCSMSVPYFGNPMTVQNGNFELVGIGETEDIKYPYQFREGDSDYLSDKWIKNALTQEEKVFSRRRPFEFHYIKEHSSLLFNIYDGKKYRAQLCVDANHRKFVIQDYIRICILAKYVKQFILSESMQQNKLSNRFRTQFADYVLENKKNKNTLTVGIKKNDWKIEDTYVCCVVQRKENASNDMSVEYFCKKWEKEIGSCISFGANGLIYILVNTRQNQEENYDWLKVMRKISREYSCMIGISMPFSDFFDCIMYFSQAIAAIKIGVHYIQDSKVYEFEHYKLNYIIKYGVASLPIASLMPSGLKTLMQYDKENHGDFCSTLMAYLRNNQNVTATVDALFIHRSTFKYRLQRIKELMETDLEDRDEELYLELVMLEMEEQFHEQHKQEKIDL